MELNHLVDLAKLSLRVHHRFMLQINLPATLQVYLFILFAPVTFRILLILMCCCHRLLQTQREKQT